MVKKNMITKREIRYFRELLKVLKDICIELIKIGEAIRDVSKS